MNHESALKLQAWLDGELPPDDARNVAAWIAQDREALALSQELRDTRASLRRGEPVGTLPESREFYWSKIERAIGQTEAPTQVRAHPSPLAWVRRFLAPAGILAVLALVLAAPMLRGRFGTGTVSRAEIDSPLEDLSSVSFRSESERMTVVWINTK